MAPAPATAKAVYVVPEGIEADINGRTFKFYPLSLKAAFKLKDLARPVAQAVAHLLTPTSDADRTEKRTVAPGGGEHIEVTVSATDPKLAELRARQRDDALLVLFDSITLPSNLELLAQLICDSLRDDFARPAKPEDWKQFLEIDLPTARSFVLDGLLPANRNVLGPFESRVAAAATTVLGKLPATLEKPPVPATAG